MGETDPRVEIVARVLDHPSVYMGGPSRRSMRTARIILDTLDAARPVEPQPEYDASDAIDRAIRNWSTISDEPLADEEVAAAARRLRKLASMNRDELGAKLDMRTAALIERQQAEIERLTTERDAARSTLETLAVQPPELWQAHARATAAEVERDDLRAKLATAVAEIERLTRGRDEWEQRTGDAINDEAVQIVRAEKAEAEVADLRAKLAKAVEALEVGTNDMSRAHESLEGSGAYLTRDDLRASMTRARTALDAIKEDRT